MKTTDKEFKKVALKLGIVMIVFLVVLNFLSIISEAANEIFRQTVTDEFVDVASNLFRAVTYSLSFLIPAFIYKKISKKVSSASTCHAASLDKRTPLVILASVSIILSCAFVNSIMVSVFNFSEFAEAFSEQTKYTSVLGVISGVIALAVAPAVCEEILFRGTVLKSLLPYGKSFAIISSAVMFGLMHRNPAQIFYTTMAGLVLGYAYVKTNSILCPMLIHFFNNLVSVAQSVILSVMPESEAYYTVSVIELLIISAGIVSILILARIEKNKKSIYDTGSFGAILESKYEYKEKKVTLPLFRSFFTSPTVLIFTIITAAETVFLLIIAAGALM